MNCRYLLKKGIRWVLDNGNIINFWHDNWMANSLLMDKVPEDCRANLNRNKKVSKFINSSRRWDLAELIGVLTAHIIENIPDIPSF